MKKKETPLEKAYRLYRAKEYAKVIALLEPQVFMYRENSDFYHVLGLACLHTGDVGGAHSYLMRCTQIDSDAIAPRLALAACHLKRRDTEAALQLWLEILDEDPDNRMAQRGLSVLRHGPQSDEVLRYRDSDRLATLFPDIRRPVAWRKLALIGAIIVVGVVIIPVFAPALLGSAGDLLRGESDLPHREGVEYAEVESGDRITSVDPDSDVRYELSESQIEQTFVDIRDYFLEERDNLANREINRIVHSNASTRLKERARTLQSYLNTPSFADFRDGFSYDEVVADPYLYEGSYVRWRGRASNIDISDDRILFDFLVGYEDGRQLDGIVPARFDFAVRVDSRYAIELLARVERVDDDSIQLRGVSARILGPAEGS